MNNQRTVLIHIGYHKAASTFLQELVFNDPSNGFCLPWSRREIFKNLILVNPFSFEVSEAQSFFEKEMTRAWDDNLIPVVSEEALSGNIYEGEHNSRVIADRLVSIFPEGKVLIIIREQVEMILSVYKHRVRSNLSVSIREYLEQPEPETGFNPLFRLEYLQYHWLVAYYQELFGKGNVLVLPYEMLRYDQPRFLSKISNFTNASIRSGEYLDIVNPGYSGFTITMKSWFNQFSPRTCNPNNSLYQKVNNSLFYYINKIFPKKLGSIFDKQIEDFVRSKVDDYYRESNQVTANLINLSLEDFGYQV